MRNDFECVPTYAYITSLLEGEEQPECCSVLLRSKAVQSPQATKGGQVCHVQLDFSVVTKSMYYWKAAVCSVCTTVAD